MEIQLTESRMWKTLWEQTVLFLQLKKEARNRREGMCELKRFKKHVNQMEHVDLASFLIETNQL